MHILDMPPFSGHINILITIENYHIFSILLLFSPGGWGGGVLPYMGYIGTCSPKGHGTSAVLVINGVSILAILIIN